MVVLLKDQVDEWARSEYGPRALEYARKGKRELDGEDALQDKLTDILRKGGEEPSPYEDTKALHAFLIGAIKNKYIDIWRRDKRRRLREGASSGCRGEDAMRMESPVEDGQVVEAAGVLRSLILDLDPLDRIVLLIDRKMTGRDVLPNTSSSVKTNVIDPDMLGLLEDAASRLEPPVSAVEARTWMSLEEVARSLGLPPGTLRSRRHRVHAKLQRSLEDRGVSFEQWNKFAIDD
jgi:DNA-directed RNA polymerase specialized sigma24 family protein